MNGTRSLEHSERPKDKETPVISRSFSADHSM